MSIERFEWVCLVARTRIWAIGCLVLACGASPVTGGATGGIGSGGSGAGSGGILGTGGTGTSGGATGTGGRIAGSGGDAPGTGGQSGGTGGGGAGNLPHFSFFVASQAGLQRLSGSQNGFGGDLRFGKADGLTGADEICRQLAEASMPGSSSKTWRALLSVSKGPSGSAVNAIDRIGGGPWYDRLGRIVAMTKADLQQPRPRGCDPTIINDLPNEDGVPNQAPSGMPINNHHMLTGSNAMGMLGPGANDTCQDWTSSALGGSAFEMQGPAVGLAYPRGTGGPGTVSGTGWIYDLHEGGCAPGATPGGAQLGPSGTVGASGGYGGFYCMALAP